MKPLLAAALIAFSSPALAQFNATRLQDIQNLHINNPRVATAGALRPSDFAALRAAGIEQVINLQLPGDKGAIADEGAVVRSFGMDYSPVPIDWKNPTLADAQAFFAAMQAAEGRAVLIHCSANARATLLFALYEITKKGRPFVEAMAPVNEVWGRNGYAVKDFPQWSGLVKQVLPAQPDKR